MPFDINDADTKAALNAAIEEATTGLVAKNKELLGKIKTLQKSAEIKPEDVERLESQVEELQGKLADAQKEAKMFGGEAKKLSDKLAAESGFTQRLLVDNGLNDALVSAGVLKEFLPAVKSLLSGKVSIVADGDNRKAVVGDKDLAAHIKEWSLSDEGKPFIGASRNSGGGAPGSGRSSGGAEKTITRSAFNALDHAERSAHFKGGGTVID